MKELKDFCSAALPVTDITDAYNRPTVQDSSSGMLAEPAPSLNYQAARWFLN